MSRLAPREALSEHFGIPTTDKMGLMSSLCDEIFDKKQFLEVHKLTFFGT
jgi:hypothetical protein